MAVIEQLLAIVEQALRDDSASQRQLFQFATSRQIEDEGRIIEADVLRWLEDNCLNDCIASLGPGFNLGFITLQRLQQVLHGPVVALSKTEGNAEGIAREIVESRHRIFTKWTFALKTIFLGWGSIDPGQLAPFVPTVDKRFEAVMGFAKGKVPQVLCPHLSPVSLNRLLELYNDSEQ